MFPTLTCKAIDRGFLLAVNNGGVKTASKLCSALTLSGLVEVREVCRETLSSLGTRTVGHESLGLCQTVPRESGEVTQGEISSLRLGQKLRSALPVSCVVPPRTHLWGTPPVGRFRWGPGVGRSWPPCWVVGLTAEAAEQSGAQVSRWTGIRGPAGSPLDYPRMSGGRLEGEISFLTIQ